MAEPCKHPATQGRAEGFGLWCMECGEKIYEVHDQPCSECAHFLDLVKVIGGAHPSVCTRKLMPVAHNLHVTYKIGAEIITGGLCFIQGNEKTNG